MKSYVLTFTLFNEAGYLLQSRKLTSGKRFGRSHVLVHTSYKMKEMVSAKYTSYY